MSRIVFPLWPIGRYEAEEASAYEILNNTEANSYSLMASVNKGFKGDMAEIRQVKNST